MDKNVQEYIIIEHVSRILEMLYHTMESSDDVGGDREDRDCDMALNELGNFKAKVRKLETLASRITDQGLRKRLFIAFYHLDPREASSYCAASRFDASLHKQPKKQEEKIASECASELAQRFEACGVSTKKLAAECSAIYKMATKGVTEAGYEEFIHNIIAMPASELELYFDECGIARMTYQPPRYRADDLEEPIDWYLLRKETERLRQQSVR